MSIIEKLQLIQQELIAPKNQYNSFGKYNYRSCEDILEGLKPCLKKVKAAVTVSDTIEMVGNRYYVKAMVIGKRDDYYNGLAGRKADSISVKEHAKVVVDSMAQKGSRGKAIYKITFRVSKQDSVIDDKLDFSGLLPDMESEE